MAKSQDSGFKTAGNGVLKVSMLRGSDFARLLRGKVLDLIASRPNGTPSLSRVAQKARPPLPIPLKNSSNINLGSRIA